MVRYSYLVGMLLSVMVLFMALGFGAAVVQGQDDEALPPQMIDVWPLPGVELAGVEPLTITFDQPMDQASVEAAFSATPALSGAFSWSDERTLNFVPADGWPGATVVEVGISASAAAQNGLSLVEDAAFEVQTIGPLEVTAVTPSEGAEGVAADARIVVTFNRPVVSLVTTAELAELSAPIMIEPALAGDGEWLNTSIYEFTPSEHLKGGTTYTVTVSAGLTTATGAVLAEDYGWSFSTLPPQILNVSPTPNQQNVTLESKLDIVFSQPMDHASTEAAFALLLWGAPVEGAFSWNEDSTRLTFTPAALLEIESNYTMNIAMTALSAGGEAMLDQGLSVPFATVRYPGIEDTSPRNGERDVYPGGGASIRFRSPMNTDTFADKVIISPETEWTPSVWGNQSLGIEFSSLPNTTYSITFLAGAEDVYGNPITTDYTFTYSTGDIRTWAYPITSNSNVSIVGAHRENTRMSLYVSGTPTVSFALFHVDDSYLEEYTRSPYYRDEKPPWATSENLLRQWTQTFDSQGKEGVAAEVLLASEQGGRLPLGNYWVVMSAPEDQIHQFSLVVASNNLTVKRSPDEVLVWVTDMPTADPLVETTVTVYHQGQAVARGYTDVEGVFRAPVDLPDNDEYITVVAEGVNQYGVWFSYGSSNLPDEQSYLYTDRPIYRPGQTVYYRGILRDRQDMAYSVPNRRSIYVTIDSTYTGQRLFEGDVPVTEFGTFSGEFLLPEDAPIGEAIVWAEGTSVIFTIAEFRVPEFEVSVAPQEDEIFQGRELNALVEASYYFGGPVSNAALNWSAWGEPASFNYTGPGRYNFMDATQEWFHHYIGDGYDVTTDSNGRTMITSDNTQPPARRPMRITVEATVTDESQQAISGRSTILAHPANVYVGQRTDRYFGQESQPMDIALIAVTADSEPLAEKRINLRVVETRWDRVPVEGSFGRYTWTQEDIEVETAEVYTAEDGTAVYTFTPPNAGMFWVEAEAMDEYELVNGSSLRFWVTGSRPVWWGEPSQTIDLIADQETYKPGDTAQILIPVPFAGASTVLVSMERAGVMTYDVIAVEGSTLLYELPITGEHVPTIHFDVTVVKGVDEESLNPDYKTGQITLDVEPVEQILTVTVTPSATLNQPRDTVSFEVLVTDAQGSPVQGEFSMALTDKAILSLMPANSGTLQAAFYGRQRNYVQTGHSLEALLDRLTDEYVGVEQNEMRAFAGEAEGLMMADSMAAAPMGAMVVEEAMDGDMAKGIDQITIREEFEQTPLWEGHVVTGPDGKATVMVDLPDNLTTWTFDTRGVTMDTAVGQATTEIMATLPLLIRPVAPRFFVVEDHVQLAAVVNNNTEQTQTVNVTLQAEGVTLDGPATQAITIDAGARGRVNWWVEAEDVRYADLTFIAIGEDGYQDATKPTLATGPDNTIPIYRYTAPDTTGTGGILREGGSATESISLPPRLDVDQGELTVHLDPSLAVTATDTFDYLKNYPHHCIEQTVSRFLPNVVTYAALKDLGLSDPVLEADLYTVLNEALEILIREQNPDGGWGWFGHMESNHLVTAYVALGLTEAKAAGFDFDQVMLDRALNFVRTDLIRPQVDTTAWRLNRQAFYFYVLAQGGQGDLKDYQALYENRLEMSTMARAYLLMAYLEMYPEQGAVADLVSDLTTSAILSATGTHWEEAYNDWWNWSSDTRTTAVVLNALTQATPENDLLPNAVRWLMVARQGDHWETTQENVWAIIGLTDWMVLTGELAGDYDYALALNRETLTDGIVTPDTVRDGQIIRIAVQDLLRDEANRLVVVRSEGTGALYYTAHMNLRLPAAETPAISRGITVAREYFMEGDTETRITSAEVGDVITARLTITLPQDIYYFVLEDPLPAGTEGVDTSLLTTSQQVAGPDLQRQWDYDPYWYWGWWWFDHTEMRDEQVNLYADFLPRGTYVYTYQIRASIAGEFQTMPSHAYAFYFPEVFGRGDGSLFTVEAAAE